MSSMSETKSNLKKPADYIELYTVIRAAVNRCENASLDVNVKAALSSNYLQ